MAKKGGNEIETLVKVLEKGNKDKRDIVIDDIISNPISCGYLLDFCQKQVGPLDNAATKLVTLEL